MKYFLCVCISLFVAAAAQADNSVLYDCGQTRGYDVQQTPRFVDDHLNAQIEVKKEGLVLAILENGDVITRNMIRDSRRWRLNPPFSATFVSRQKGARESIVIQVSDSLLNGGETGWFAIGVSNDSVYYYCWLSPGNRPYAARNEHPW